MLASKVAEPYVSKKVYAAGNAAVSGGVASGVAEKGKKFISYDGPTEGTKVSNDKSNYEFVGLNEKL